ncbi:MAG: hypothetical protein AB1847_17020 [bacterium]
MDKTVQQNTASAQESAAASKGMDIQAEGLQRIVHGLVALIEGGKKNRTHDAAGAESSQRGGKNMLSPGGSKRKPCSCPARLKAAQMMSFKSGW